MTETAPTLDLSVIVPARNEERVLAGCLNSLLGQSERGFALGEQWELLIIDDESSDRTAEIAGEAARNHAGVTVLAPPRLERGGFTGKNNACWTAAQQAKVVGCCSPTPTRSTKRATCRARSTRPKDTMPRCCPLAAQIVTGFWQQAVDAVGLLGAGERLSPEGGQRSRESARGRKRTVSTGRARRLLRGRWTSRSWQQGARGRRVGRDVKGSADSAGKARSIRFRYAPDALSARMYATLPEMLEGWTRIWRCCFRVPCIWQRWRVVDLVLFFGIPAFALGLPYLVSWQRWALLLIWARTLWRFYARVARSNFPAVDCALSILGVPLFVFFGAQLRSPSRPQGGELERKKLSDAPLSWHRPILVLRDIRLAWLVRRSAR